MPEIINRTEETVHADSIEPHPANPNDGDVAAIAESIRQNGFYGRVVVRDSTGKILAGEHRWRAAQEVGLTEIPIERVECDDETAMRILLADNRTAEKAEREPEPLAELLQELEQTDDELDGTGYDGRDLDQLLEDLDEPAEDDWADAFDSVPEGEKEPFQQRTFTLHDKQADTVEQALQVAKQQNDFTHTPNENSNGNALALICKAFL